MPKHVLGYMTTSLLAFFMVCTSIHCILFPASQKYQEKSNFLIPEEIYTIDIILIRKSQPKMGAPRSEKFEFCPAKSSNSH